MRDRIPLGEPEDLQLEFKSSEALEKPEAIGREVAAMLNTSGGDVWVGLGENGNGVAVELQPVPHPERAADSLLDSLVDRLEPSPLADEMRVEAIAVNEGFSVLRIRVQKGERGPYALLKSGGRVFQRRIGRRLQTMSRDELFAASKRQGEREGRLEVAKRKIWEERNKARQQEDESMWLRIQPIEDVAIDLRLERFEELLNDPTLTRNRRSGWHFAKASKRPRIANGETITWSYENAFSVQAHRTGGIIFLAPLNSLRWKGEERELSPGAVLEYPISAFRLARTLLRDLQSARTIDVLADIALFGIRGWKLRKGPIKDEYQLHEPQEYPEDEDDLTWPEPISLRLSDILEQPDRCGFRLVRRVYEAFGYREHEMPREFDPETGHLVLPE